MAFNLGVIMDYIEIKNLEKYQPQYKDGRKAIWIRWDISSIEDYRISKLTSAQRWLFIELICLGCRHKNQIPYDLEWLSQVAKHPYKHILNDLKRLQEKELIVTNCNKMLQNVPTDRQTIQTLQTIQTDNISSKLLDYFSLKTNKKLKHTTMRIGLIENRLKDYTEEQIRLAIDNFVKDDWVDRHKFMDIQYCIGIRNKVDNLEKWLNFKSKELSLKEKWLKKE